MKSRGHSDHQHEPVADWLERFDPFAETFFARYDVPGAAVVLLHRGEVAYRRGFGLRDREAGTPAAPTTRFGLASLTKSFTSLTLLALEARGILNLDDPVTDYLPEFSYPGIGRTEPVRLRHLASHTSGLPPLRALDYAIRPSQLGDPAEAFNERDYTGAPRLDDLAALLAYLRAGERPALAPPGQLVSYSNEGFGLLGAVIERVAGAPLEEVMRREVFEPLGMNGATFDRATAEASGECTRLYTRTPDGNVIASPRWEEAPAYLGTGFLKASVDDLARSLAYLSGGGDPRLPVTAERLAELTRPRGWVAPGADYGLGWTIRHDYHGVRLVRHGGSLKGVSAHQGLVPQLDLGVAILTNLDEVPVLRLFFAAVNAALGAPLARPAYEVPAGDAITGSMPDLSAFAGVFASGEPWGRLELRPAGADGGLRAFSGEQATDAGVPVLLDDSEFVLVGEDGAWDGGRFHRDAAGQVVAVQFGTRWYDRKPDRAD